MRVWPLKLICGSPSVKYIDIIRFNDPRLTFSLFLSSARLSSFLDLVVAHAVSLAAATAAAFHLP